MLVQLSIRDIVLIEQLDITFGSGLSVLTGETGAGKSILLDSLSLTLGARGDGGLVRNGVEQGQVTAMFDLPSGHQAMKQLEENGISHEGYLLMKRVQSADGRSKAYINDQPVSVSFMRQVGQGLVELHGQHDERALLEAEMHRSLLDEFGGLSVDVDAVSRLWKEWQALRKESEQFRKRVEEARKEADYLASSVEELTKLAPEAGEELKLAEQRQQMMRSETIATDLDDAVTLLSGNHSPVPALTALAKQLSRKAADNPGLLEEAIAQLDTALDAIHLAQQELETALRNSEFDPKELESSEERLFALRAASRKYSVAVENLPELAVKLADDLDNLNSGEERLAKLTKETQEKHAAFSAKAKSLSASRKQIGEQLVGEVMRELPALKLDQAVFMVHHVINEETPNEGGIDQIDFWVQTNPGSKAGPMVKVASGGELSRFLLALKVALADKGSAPTLVFDEIDTGVGGAVADAIGRRLAKLSSKVQVLSVTHAPQVAARAINHFVIAKKKVDADIDGRLATGIRAINRDERREEIARMLAGASVTDEARAAAEQLINQSAA